MQLTSDQIRPLRIHVVSCGLLLLLLGACSGQRVEQVPVKAVASTLEAEYRDVPRKDEAVQLADPSRPWVGAWEQLPECAGNCSNEMQVYFKNGSARLYSFRGLGFFNRMLYVGGDWQKQGDTLVVTYRFTRESSADELGWAGCCGWDWDPSETEIRVLKRAYVARYLIRDIVQDSLYINLIHADAAGEPISTRGIMEPGKPEHYRRQKSISHMAETRSWPPS